MRKYYYTTSQANFYISMIAELGVAGYFVILQGYG